MSSAALLGSKMGTPESPLASEDSVLGPVLVAKVSDGTMSQFAEASASANAPAKFLSRPMAILARQPEQR